MNNTDFLPLISFIESKGGPKFPEWCYLHHEIIEGFGWTCNEGGEAEQGDDADVVNHEAVAAVACMWVMDVSSWYCRAGKQRTTSVFPSPRDRRWWVIVENEEEKAMPRLFPTKELAFLALLTAICEALGYEGESNEPTD